MSIIRNNVQLSDFIFMITQISQCYNLFRHTFIFLQSSSVSAFDICYECICIKLLVFYE